MSFDGIVENNNSSMAIELQYQKLQSHLRAMESYGV